MSTPIDFEILDKEYKKNAQSNDMSSLYYDGIFYDLFESNAVGSIKHSDDMQFWLNIAREYGNSILELGSGTGRIAGFLAEAGFDITGLEISESMLSIAKTKHSKIRWIHADACDFDLNQKFPLIIFPYNGMLHIHSDKLKYCFSSVKNHIESDGKFVIDIANPSLSLLLKISQSQGERLAAIFEDPKGTGIVVVSQEVDYDAANQILTNKRIYRFVGSGREVCDIFKRRIYFPQEIETLLRWSGFEIEKKYGDYDLSLFTSDAPQQLIVCKSSL